MTGKGQWWKWLGIGVATLVSVCGVIFFFAYRTQPPNVIVILLDAVRADHLPAYGYNRQTTPSIQKYLFERGFVFLHAFSAGSATPYTIPALFTGKVAHTNGYNYPNGPLADESVTLAEHLQKRGYQTHGFVSNPYLRSKSKLNQGFMEYDSLEDHYNPYPRASVIVDKALEFLNKRSRRPFFLYLHFMDTHGPYLPPAPFDTVFTTQGVTPDDMELNKVVWRDIKEWRGKSLEERRKMLNPARLIDLYDGELLYLDHELGRFFQALDQQRIFTNSLIILTADHGEEFLDHGYVAHMNIPYEELLQVPFFVKLPASLAVDGGKVITAPVHATLDVLPTVLSVVDGSRADTDGESVLPFLTQEEVQTRQKLFVADNYFLQVARQGKWKYIGTAVPPAKLADWLHQLSFLEEELLFDLEEDPKETTNLAAVHPERVAALKSELATFVENSSAIPQPEEQVTIDPLQHERLRSLGYIHE